MGAVHRMSLNAPPDVLPPVPAQSRSKEYPGIEGFADVPDDFKLPAGTAANVKKGEKYFKKYCSQCHSIYPDNRMSRAGQSQLGPTLFNIYGRASGIADIQNKQAEDRTDGILWIDGPLMNYMKN